MSCRIEQKNGNWIYVYEAMNHWNPVKKRAQQKRVYPVARIPKLINTELSTETDGPIDSLFPTESFMPLKCCAQGNRLQDILNHAFGSEDGAKIFAMVAYCATGGISCPWDGETAPVQEDIETLCDTQ